MRYLLITALLTSYLFALINAPIRTTVASVNHDEEEITVTSFPQAQIGMYGGVVHWFNAKHSIALAWVEVTDIEGETITLKMKPIFALEQSALPSGNWEVQVGDEVVMGYNYHRALLIAPDASVYKKVTQYHPERKWVHPDIFATTLSANGHPSPLSEDFSQICRANNIGLVSIYFDKSLLTLDCHSFKILENKSTTLSSEEPQRPFYTRVHNIEANWFGDGSDEIEEYNAYYISLISEHNPDNEWIQNYAAERFEAESTSSWFSSDSQEEVTEEVSEATETDDEFIPDE